MLVILSILNCNVFVHKELGWGHLGTSRGADTDCATARLRCGLTTDFLRSDIFSA